VTLHVAEIGDRSQWDRALAALPLAHVLQCWDWGDFKGRWGWQPTRLLFEREGRPLAAAQILRRRLPYAPLSVSYVPKGPALDYSDASLLASVLSTLEGYARRWRSIFLKIDPDVRLGVGPDEAPLQAEAGAVLQTLAARGWRPSAEQIQFKNTVLVDLTADEAGLLAAMKPKTRYNIGLASRRRVSVHAGGEPDLPAFYKLYRETARRDGFLIRPPAYYLDVWAQSLLNGWARLLLAEVEGEVVAGLMLFLFGRTAWYMYGASSDRQRHLMPSALLQWEAIRVAKQSGCTRYDMWGAPDRFDEGDSMWGVYRFKTGFGGETVRGLGAFDYPPSARLYWAYTVAMPRVLALMRRRHGQAENLG
jgi:lipid II:glycine glycyltransferase (peptidoglycan interpeptide bridge formation enzyme)